MLGRGARDSGVAWGGCCAVVAAMVLLELTLTRLSTRTLR